MVCPVIDVIDWNTFEYLGNSGEPQIGGFDWRLVFTWHVVPERERLRMRSPTDVIRSGVVSLRVSRCVWSARQGGPLGGMSAVAPLPLSFPERFFIFIKNHCYPHGFYVGVYMFIYFKNCGTICIT